MSITKWLGYVYFGSNHSEGQLRIILTQATRHHATQMDFFRKGFKALEAVDPVIRIVAEKHRIDYQLSELDNGTSEVSEDTSSYEIMDDGELSFDYRHKKQGLDNVATSSYQMEENTADIPHLQVPTLGDPEMNHYKNQGETLFSMQARVSSYSKRPKLRDMPNEALEEEVRALMSDKSGETEYQESMQSQIDTIFYHFI
ncbi:hypothetical protein HanPI659440_Chr01g0018961 [Helianthus annuus]|nr:hypothetical protein HanPI659440_Chr01g0018961 [Helianthus annuus]